MTAPPSCLAGGSATGLSATDAWIRAVAGDAWTMRAQPARVESFRFVSPQLTDYATIPGARERCRSRTPRACGDPGQSLLTRRRLWRRFSEAVFTCINP